MIAAVIVLIIFLIVALIMWLSRKVSLYGLIYYMIKNGYKLPDEAETRECTQFVLKNIIKDLFRNGC